MEELLGVLFLTVVAPIWIISHYVSKAKASRGLTSEDETMLSEIWGSAKKMEERIHTLERILDDQSPGWRGRS
jgi:phage shock protein B